MRIIGIRTRNYRTLENIELSFASSYCTISGKNNAGKSWVIRLLNHLLRRTSQHPWMREQLDYAEDRTHWVKSESPIIIEYQFELNKSDDPALIFLAAKLMGKDIKASPVPLTITQTATAQGDTTTTVEVAGTTLEDQPAAEIVNRVGDSDLMFLYNSTRRTDDMMYPLAGRPRSLYEVVLSEDERRHLKEAAKTTERRIRNFARNHRDELNNILGKLSEKYDVEFTPIERLYSHHMPFGISLKDRSVQAPLSDWGSGTQNRTEILIAVLQANRIRTTESAQNKITPLVVVEEPESFLHPSAQAEFGKILRAIATELGIQIIVTTHSPYMLNQAEPSSNILLARETKYRKSLQTIRVPSDGPNWMVPFADHLGVSAAEFTGLDSIFALQDSKVLLVEGEIDKEYFHRLQQVDYGIEKLRSDIEIAPYGGKDTLKNTLLVQFVLRKFDKVFVTYDLDCKDDVSHALQRLNLKEGADHIPLGINKPGRNAIEGLLPESVLKKVNGRETDLVMALGSTDNKDRRKAKDTLKKKYLEEFKKGKTYSAADLKPLATAVKKINNYFG